jgi:predicted phage-related endonuclease
MTYSTMKITKYEDQEAWESARAGRITGTRAKDVAPKLRGTGERAGFYEIISERVAVPPSGENVMDRGKRLEEEAIERFAKLTGKKVNTDLVIWEREDEPDIAVSVDGYVEGKKITEGIEAKCLSSAKHIEAYLAQEVPTEYEWQVLQYFVVNDDLQKLYMVFYDPRMPRDLFYLTIERDDERVKESLEMQREALHRIREIEDTLTFK